MHVYVHAFMYMQVYVYTFRHVFVYMHMYMYTHVCVFVHVYVYICMELESQKKWEGKKHTYAKKWKAPDSKYTGINIIQASFYVNLFKGNYLFNKKIRYYQFQNICESEIYDNNIPGLAGGKWKITVR